MHFTLFVQVVAWLTLGLMMISMVVPAAPKHDFRVGANFDGVFLSGLMGFLFVAAYPDDRRLIALLCVFVVIASESLQVILPDRHFNLERIVVKILGTAVGLLVGGLLMQFVH